MYFLFKGLLIGFFFGVPIGPVTIFCIRRILTEGKLSGFISGLGVVTADTFYAFLAAFGFTAVASLFLEYSTSIRILGGLLITYFAIKIITSNPHKDLTKINENRSPVHLFGSAFILTITNPSTIFSFIAIFAGLGIKSIINNYYGAVETVLGVFLGAVVWWLFLTYFVGSFKNKFSHEGMLWVNRISGGLMLVLVVILFWGIRW